MPFSNAQRETVAAEAVERLKWWLESLNCRPLYTRGPPWLS